MGSLSRVPPGAVNLYFPHLSTDLYYMAEAPPFYFTEGQHLTYSLGHDRGAHQERGHLQRRAHYAGATYNQKWWGER